MKSATYKKSFDLFIRRTDEKSVIENFIERHIPLHSKMSFLDIGGGNGALARKISPKVASTLIIEPNKFFLRDLKKNNSIRVVNSKWEAARLDNSYDFILAAYVVTYFSPKAREKLIKKIYKCLKSGGLALILSVDAKRGSWRGIHTYFYKLIGLDHSSSDDELKKILRKYKPKKKVFKTRVVAKNDKEMLKILGFDFYKYPGEFRKFSENLRQFMRKHTDREGRVSLEIVHNAYIINKP